MNVHTQFSKDDRTAIRHDDYFRNRNHHLSRTTQWWMCCLKSILFCISMIPSLFLNRSRSFHSLFSCVRVETDQAFDSILAKPIEIEQQYTELKANDTKCSHNKFTNTTPTLSWNRTNRIEWIRKQCLNVSLCVSKAMQTKVSLLLSLFRIKWRTNKQMKIETEWSQEQERTFGESNQLMKIK